MYVPLAHDASWMTALMPPVLGWIGALLGGLGMLGGLFKKKGVQQGAGVLGGILGGASKGSQDARLYEDMANARIYDTAMQGALGRGQLDLAQQKFGLEAPGQRVSAVTRGDLLRNVQDFSMGGPGSGSGAERMGGWSNAGGLRPSAIGADSKEAARLMIAQHLAKLQQPEQFADIQFPETPQLSKAGWLEKIMGGAGLGGSILGGIGQLGGKAPTPTMPGDPYDPQF